MIFLSPFITLTVNSGRTAIVFFRLFHIASVNKTWSPLKPVNFVQTSTITGNIQRFLGDTQTGTRLTVRGLTRSWQEVEKREMGSLLSTATANETTALVRTCALQSHRCFGSRRTRYTMAQSIHIERLLSTYRGYEFTDPLWQAVVSTTPRVFYRGRVRLLSDCCHGL